MNTLLGILTVLAAGLAIYIGWKLMLSLLMEVPAYTSVLVLNRITNSTRACNKSGWRLIWPWEKKVDGSEVAMVISNHIFENDFETQEEIAVTLKISFDTIPDKQHLLEYRRFDSATRLNGITERIKSILTVEIRKLKTRDEVMNSYTPLANEVKKRFEETFSEDGKRLEEYYGVNLKKLEISNTDLPPELKEATARKEAAAKENQTRNMEMNNVTQRAKKLVKEAKASGTEMPMETAVKIVQVQDGKIKESISVFGIHKGTQDILKTLAEGVFSGKR